MKKIDLSHDAEIAVSWFFCGSAFGLLLFVIGVMFNIIKIG